MQVLSDPSATPQSLQSCTNSFMKSSKCVLNLPPPRCSCLCNASRFSRLPAFLPYGQHDRCAAVVVTIRQAPMKHEEGSEGLTVGHTAINVGLQSEFSQEATAAQLKVKSYSLQHTVARQLPPDIQHMRLYDVPASQASHRPGRKGMMLKTTVSCPMSIQDTRTRGARNCLDALQHVQEGHCSQLCLIRCR